MNFPFSITNKSNFAKDIIIIHEKKTNFNVDSSLKQINNKLKELSKIGIGVPNEIITEIQDNIDEYEKLNIYVLIMSYLSLEYEDSEEYSDIKRFLIDLYPKENNKIDLNRLDFQIEVYKEKIKNVREGNSFYIAFDNDSLTSYD